MGTLPSDHPDFADAYDEHVWQVYAFFAYRVRGKALAEDLTQETFERALRAWQRYDPARANVLTWLLSIARNLLIDHYRADRSGREQPIDPESDDWAAPPDEPSGLGVSAELEAALAQLNDREREVVALRFGADLTGQQIAEVTELSLANVQQILSRSLRRLRKALEAQAESGPRPAALEAPISRSSIPEQP